MTPIHGYDVLLQMKIDDLWKNVLCGTDCTFNYNPEFITKTGPNSPAREFAIRTYEWDFSVSGLTPITSDSTILSYFYMLQLSVRRSSHDFRMKFTDEAGNIKYITGTGFVGQSSISGPVSDFSNGSIQIKGTGAFDISSAETITGGTIHALSDYWTTTPGQNFVEGGNASVVHSYLLDEGMQILVCFREGLEYDPIESGLPSGRQFKHDTTTGYLYFDTLLPFNPGETVFIVFKDV